MKVIYHGHSCVEVRAREASLIIDPFLRDNPASQTNPDDVRVDYILLTHGHGDHVGDAMEIAQKNDATVIATFELATYFGWKGVKSHPMNLGGSYTFEFGKVKLTYAFHSSALTLDENQQIIYMGMPGGFVIECNEGQTLYHAGDTGLFSDLKLIGEQHDIDLAFLPIGDNLTMGPDDAVTAAEWTRSNRVVPIHYNTFPVIEQDADAFADRLKEKGIEGWVLQSGEETEITSIS